MLVFLFVIKRVKLVLKLKFNLPFWPKISKKLRNIEKHWETLRNIETLKTLSNFSTYWLRNIEFNTMSMLKIKTLKTYSMSMSMSIFSMFISMFNVDLQTLSLVSSSSQFSLLPQLREKGTLASKVVRDSKIIISLLLNPWHTL